MVVISYKYVIQQKKKKMYVSVWIKLTHHLTRGSFVFTQFLIYKFSFCGVFFFFLLFSFYILKIINYLSLFLLFIFIVLYSSHFFRLFCWILFIVLTCTHSIRRIYSHITLRGQLIEALIIIEAFISKVIHLCRLISFWVFLFIYSPICIEEKTNKISNSFFFLVERKLHKWNKQRTKKKKKTEVAGEGLLWFYHETNHFYLSLKAPRDPQVDPDTQQKSYLDWDLSEPSCQHKNWLHDSSE